MGDRYILKVICENCGLEDDDVFYAPTCGFLDWTCPKCGTVIDLEKHTGIDALGCANTTYGEDYIREQRAEKS